LKTKFAEEKSEYAQLIKNLMHYHPTVKEYTGVMKRLEALEKIIKDQGDELIFIVTTRDTNPLVEGKTCAPPMSEKDIKNS